MLNKINKLFKGGGVSGETLDTGWHVVSPMKQVKNFTISNEQIILSKDSREGSEGDDSFKVSTSDDAMLAISFQMSYRFNPETLVDTYKKFKGMDGEAIVTACEYLDGKKEQNE